MGKDFIDPFGANNTFGSAAAAPKPIHPRTAALNYFYKHKGTLEMDDFARHWDEIGRADLRISQYAAVLRHISLTYGRQSIERDKDLSFWLRNNLSAWEAGVTRTLGGADNNDVRSIVASSPRLGFSLEPSLMKGLETQLCSILSANYAQQPKFLIKDLTQILWGWATAGYVPEPETLHAIYTSALGAMWQFQQIHVASNLRSLAIIDCLAPADSPIRPICRAMAADFIDIFRLDKAETFQQAQYRDAVAWFDFDVPIPPLIQRREQKSGYEVEFGKFLPGDLAGSFRRADTLLPGLEKNSDYCFKGENGRRLHIEYDGDSHFQLQADNQMQYDGPTIFQSFLALKLHPERVLLRMPWMVYEVIREMTPVATNRRAVMIEIVKAGLAQPSGNALVIQQGASAHELAFVPL